MECLVGSAVRTVPKPKKTPSSHGDNNAISCNTNKYYYFDWVTSQRCDDLIRFPNMDEISFIDCCTCKIEIAIWYHAIKILRSKVIRPIVEDLTAVCGSGLWLAGVPGSPLGPVEVTNRVALLPMAPFGPVAYEWSAAISRHHLMMLSLQSPSLGPFSPSSSILMGYSTWNKKKQNNCVSVSPAFKIATFPRHEMSQFIATEWNLPNKSGDLICSDSGSGFWQLFSS